MQSDVIRAPNGRVITRDYIAKQYSQRQLNDTGIQLGANNKSSICFPALSSRLLECSIEELETYVEELFQSRFDPCFTEIVKSRLLKDFNHHPDTNWLKGLAVKTKSHWDVYYYYLTLKLIAVSIKHDLLPTAGFSFAILGDRSGIDSRMINGLRRALIQYIGSSEVKQVNLVLQNNVEFGLLLVNSAECELKINLNAIVGLTESSDVSLSIRLITLYLNEMLYKANLEFKKSDVLFMCVILFMTVVTLSPKVGKIG
jgi:hypothetical protein